jgi:lysozyme
MKRQHVAALALAFAITTGFEGIAVKAYRDPVGIPTICFGETRGVQIGDVSTAEACKASLKDGLARESAALDKCIQVPVPDKSYAAFLSMAWNIGVGAWCSSTLARKLNAGDLRGACNEMARWVKAGALTLPGLVRRRREEETLCLDGAA